MHLLCRSHRHRAEHRAIDDVGIAACGRAPATATPLHDGRDTTVTVRQVAIHAALSTLPSERAETDSDIKR